MKKSNCKPSAREKSFDFIARCCYNARCKYCMKTKPKCRKSRLKLATNPCQSRLSKRFLFLGYPYPNDIKRDNLEYFISIRNHQRKIKKQAKKRKELKVYHASLKIYGQICNRFKNKGMIKCQM